MSLNSHEMAYINNIINDIYGQILFKAIPMS